MQRILFVCLGNICRSPAAEAVFAAKARAAGLNIATDSAGTGGWHIGDPPYPPMIAEGRARGYDLAPLRARQVQAGDFTSFGLIIAMDSANHMSLDALRPAGNATPVRLMLDYLHGAEGDEVPDPYYTRDFGAAFDLIEAAADAMIARLQQASGQGVQICSAVSPKAT
ncbi:MAG: low molecular weight protein-tyrosine-phosphatase [Albidovulum sp.]|uniref:low molecular weight protein-tyrosine-phosphatase n=1 Tax=Albidovulum sp. TaxID=1872424 RepID=UPI003CA30064